MNNPAAIEHDARRAILALLTDVGGFEAKVWQVPEEVSADVCVRFKNGNATTQILIEAKTRITPQTASAVCERFARYPGDEIRLLYAPVISPRVDEIAKEYGIGFIDGAGNCRIRSATGNLFIERSGLRDSKRPPQVASDPFSPKSSRIVRAMLSEPKKGWQVRELADHISVDVSVGLVSKVKKKLIEQGYAIEFKRRIYLRDPIGLLKAWSEKYDGPIEKIPLYFRGDAEAAEATVRNWCLEHQLHYRLAGFSAAWRLAPEVRYHVAQVYVEANGFALDLLDSLKDYGGKRVDSGANLILWKPFDRSALTFAPDQPDALKEKEVTSPIQTYLDLKNLAGRGEEAAETVYSRWLEEHFQYAARMVEEMSHENV